MSLSITTATIPGTGSVSAGVQLSAQGLTGIYFPNNFATAPLSFLVSLDAGTTWDVLADQNGNEVAIPSSAGQQIGLDPDDWVGYTNIKVRSGTSGSPVAQPSDAVVGLITQGSTPAQPPAEPNPRRTINVENIGCVGEFTSYWSTADDVATFDLTFILAAGEVVTEIDTFDLEFESSTGAIDSDPDARVLGVPSIVGVALNQRFGNWLPGIEQIIYRVDLVCRTSLGNVLPFYAFVAVNQPPELG